MPNGTFEGTKDEWRRLEAPLRSVDLRLWFFALRHLLPFSKNGRGGHEWPERSFRWGSAVSRLIQIYLKEPGTLGHNLWICASEDRPDGRYWKERTLREAVTIDEIARDLPALLESALNTVRGWRSSDLQIARLTGPTAGAVEQADGADETRG